MVHLMGGFESQPFSRPVIQFMRHRITFHLRHLAQAHALWEILPEQSIEVFVGTSLP